MAITNCTVFDSSYSQSYSVIDYPRCPDDLVKADIPSGSDQEKVFKHTSHTRYERLNQGRFFLTAAPYLFGTCVKGFCRDAAAN